MAKIDRIVKILTAPFKKALQAVGLVLSSITKGISSFIALPGVARLRAAIANRINGIITALNAPGGRIGGMLTAISNRLRAAIAKISPALVSAKGFFDKIVAKIQPIVTTIQAKIQPIVTTIKTHATNIMNSPKWGEALKWLQDHRPSWQSTKEGVRNLFGGAQIAMQYVIPAITVIPISVIIFKSLMLGALAMNIYAFIALSSSCIGIGGLSYVIGKTCGDVVAAIDNSMNNDPFNGAARSTTEMQAAITLAQSQEIGINHVARLTLSSRTTDTNIQFSS